MPTASEAQPTEEKGCRRAVSVLEDAGGPSPDSGSDVGGGRSLDAPSRS